MTPDARHTKDRGESWTVLKIIRWTTGFLQTKGIDTPRLDAEIMLADILGMNRVDLYLNFDRPLDSDELAGYRERVRRRAAREPAAYIIGRKEFYSLDFRVGPDVLVPRPETELLVDEALETVRERWPDEVRLHLADVGTGSGAIAVALASELPRADIWAVDASQAALNIAGDNATKHGVGDRIRFRHGDLFGPLTEAAEPFHLIAANLPYVPTSAFANMAPEVRDYEPHPALDGGPDGLDLIRRAIAEAPAYLRPGAALLLEIWPTHAGAIKELAAGHGYARTRIIPDLAARDRLAVLEIGPETR